MKLCLIRISMNLLEYIGNSSFKYVLESNSKKICGTNHLNIYLVILLMRNCNRDHSQKETEIF